MENNIVKTTDIALFAKSFYMLGDSLSYCYDCKYCRLNGEKCEEKHFHLMPGEINHNFVNIPVAVNLFYGDPLLQIDNTVDLLKRLEKSGHKGPVLIVTKGDFRKFPDIPFNLDLHIAFSTFGVDSKYDGSTMERFRRNLEQTRLRKNNYKYSIEYRPICYGINDTVEAFANVLQVAKNYGLAIGYSGLQGKPESVKIWEENGIDLKPYPGFSFGHKKVIADQVSALFEEMATKYGVLLFRKTSCLFSYVHGLERDYNAHYYRPSEMGCDKCVMKEKCQQYKENLTMDADLKDIIPFDYEIVDKTNHTCILMKTGKCEYPSPDCAKIRGKILKINDNITISDLRVIKWLTGYTVDANFCESSYISEKWVEDRSLIKKR